MMEVRTPQKSINATNQGRIYCSVFYLRAEAERNFSLISKMYAIVK